MSGPPPGWAQGVDYPLLVEALPRVDPAGARIVLAPRLVGLIRRVFLAEARAITAPWGVYVHPDAIAGEPAGPLLAHELAHLEQWRRLGVVGFLRLYLGDYVRARRAGRSHEEAYRSITLEEEASSLARFVSGTGQ